jgi:hypothetical protein
VSSLLVTQLIITGAIVLTGVLSVAVTCWLRNRPARWSTARDRLIARNPMLNGDPTLRWTVASQRVRTGWLTALTVSVALLVASDRPTATAIGDNG